MTETDYVHLILQNRASGVFTTRELSRWIEQSCGLKKDTARKRALRILTRLPIEAVSEKMFKIRTDVALAVNRDFGQKTQASAASPEEGGSESKKIKKVKKEKEDSPEETASKVQFAREVVDYFNEKCGKRLKVTSGVLRLINARRDDGFSLEDFKQVIEIKRAHWAGTDMEKFLRPETIFTGKMNSYLNESGPNSKAGTMAMYDFSTFIKSEGK